MRAGLRRESRTGTCCIKTKFIAFIIGDSTMISYLLWDGGWKRRGLKKFNGTRNK
jgi:hypothetical protein